MIKISILPRTIPHNEVLLIAHHNRKAAETSLSQKGLQLTDGHSVLFDHFQLSWSVSARPHNMSRCGGVWVFILVVQKRVPVQLYVRVIYSLRAAMV